MSIGLENCAICEFPVDEPVEIGGNVYCTFCAANLPQPKAEPTELARFLRPPQREAVNNVFDEWKVNDSTLVVSPTGTGKTVIFSAVALRASADGRIMVVAHRDELIRQAADKIHRFTGLECDIEMGERYADQCTLESRCPVIVTSVQSMSRARRLERFNPSDFCAVIIDEAHHGTAKTYGFIIQWSKRNPLCRLLGVTATPDRADEEELGRIFKSVAYDYTIIQAIDDGWLVPIEQQFIQVEGLDLSTVDTVAGELNQGQLGRILEQEKMLHGYAEPTMRIADGRQTLVFATTVAQAEQIAAIMNRHESGSAEWICGDAIKCPMEKRRDILKQFSAKSFQFLVNCEVLLEGYDEPNIELVSIAKPTKSRARYAQMIGRGTRPLAGLVDGFEEAAERRAAIAASGKPSLLVLDFVGNSGRHKLMHTGDILGTEFDYDIIAEATRAVTSKSSRGERQDMLLALREAVEHKKQRLADKARVRVKAKFQTTRIDPFGVWDILPKREPGWFKGKKPSEKMKAWLVKMKAWKDDMGFWEAKQILDEATARREKGLCTYGQAKCLARYGFDTKEMTFEVAHEEMDKLAKNGWKR